MSTRTAPLPAILRLDVSAEYDVVVARQRAREIARLVGFDLQDQTRIATSVSEIARNAFQHAEGGSVTFFLEGTREPQILRIRIEDSGPGFPDGFLSEDGRPKLALGTGLATARRLMDDLQIDSVSGEGAAVLLGKTVPPYRHALAAKDTLELADQLAKLKPTDALEELRLQNQELARTLEELEARNEKLRETHEELTASRDRYSELYDFAPVGYLTMNEEGTLVEANVTLAEMLGTPRSSLRNNPLSVFVLDEDLDLYERLRNEVFAKRAPHRRELRFQSVTGEPFWVRLECVPVEPSEGKDVLVRVIVIDVTVRKTAEMELHRYRDHLESLVEERTAEISKRSDEIQAVNKEMETFSYSISHDLRGPLRRMNGFGQILLAKYGNRLDESGRHYLERICTNARHMAQLIDDLLTLSRIKRSELTHEPVDLSALARMIAETLSNSEPRRRVRFEIQDEIVVQGDYSLLAAVLSNLFDNAWKFSRNEDEARIEFGTLKNADCDPPNKSLDAEAEVCCVRDNGVGFDMTYVDKIFAAFQRLHLLDEFEGTGIGLATVERIVHRHGGHVWARGEPGVGATFYFNLPK